MGISNIRTVEGRRDSDKHLTYLLETPGEQELAKGHSLALTLLHDDGEEDTVLLSPEEILLLINALDEWHYGA
jgi:hypothetical protein